MRLLCLGTSAARVLDVACQSSSSLGLAQLVLSPHLTISKRLVIIRLLALLAEVDADTRVSVVGEMAEWRQEMDQPP